MAHAATLWAIVTPAGLKDGTSLANAAGIDPNAADDIWTIVNADVAAANGTTIKLCADAVVSLGTTILITRDATADNPFIVQGRDAADSVDTQVALDMGGGSNSVWSLGTADYWVFRNITAQNTDRANPNHGWYCPLGADFLSFFNCKAQWCYDGFHLATGAIDATFWRCYAVNNGHNGFSSTSASNDIEALGCIASYNGLHGFERTRRTVRCIADHNGTNGFNDALWVDRCVAYANTATGIDASALHSFFVDCITVLNGAFGVSATNGWVYVERLARFGNVGGVFSGTDYSDNNGVTLTANPFVEGTARYKLAAGAGGATATNNGADSNIEDLNNGSWNGDVAIGDRIRFYENGVDEDDGEEALVTAISVGGDDDVITVSPQATAAAQKQCWLGGGNFALNDTAGGGAACRGLTHVAADGFSTGYVDLGAVQHEDAGGGLLRHSGMTGGIDG